MTFFLHLPHWWKRKQKLYLHRSGLGFSPDLCVHLCTHCARSFFLLCPLFSFWQPFFRCATLERNKILIARRRRGFLCMTPGLFPWDQYCAGVCALLILQCGFQADMLLHISRAAKCEKLNERTFVSENRKPKVFSSPPKKFRCRHPRHCLVFVEETVYCFALEISGRLEIFALQCKRSSLLHSVNRRHCNWCTTKQGCACI